MSISRTKWLIDGLLKVVIRWDRDPPNQTNTVKIIISSVNCLSLNLIWGQKPIRKNFLQETTSLGSEGQEFQKRKRISCYVTPKWRLNEIKLGLNRLRHANRINIIRFRFSRSETKPNLNHLICGPVISNSKSIFLPQMHTFINLAFSPHQPLVP